MPAIASMDPRVRRRRQVRSGVNLDSFGSQGSRAMAPSCSMPTLRVGAVGWFVKSPLLRPNEQVVFDRLANRQVGWRALGGRLVGTQERLIFTPNVVDSRTGGEEWSIPLRDVRGVTVERRSDPGYGRLAKVRPKVFLTTDTGEEAFLVNRAHHVGKMIADLAARASA